MQTFLPHPNFERSATALDRQRLGKQRVEVLQILRALNDPTYGWQNHPAVKMWRGHQAALADYGLAVCSEWVRRGYRDSCYDKITAYAQDDHRAAPMPPWFSGSIHASHRAALLAKDPEWYGRFGWVEVAGIDYVWPVK